MNQADMQEVSSTHNKQTNHKSLKKTLIQFPTFVKDGRKTKREEKRQNENKTGTKKREKKGKEEEESSVLFHAALFHSGTPLVARSTAEAASQSPLPVCPVTLHHWGQRAPCLPINEPASAPVPLCMPQTPTIQWEAEITQKEKDLAVFLLRGCPALCGDPLRPRICFHFKKLSANKRSCTLRVPLSPGGNCSPL